MPRRHNSFAHKRFNKFPCRFSYLCWNLTYKALAELGKARKTTFLCRYLHLLSLRREIHEGLNVVENWNSANDFILYGRGGEIATNASRIKRLLC